MSDILAAEGGNRLSVRTVWRSLVVVILLTAIGGGVAYAVSTVLPRTYRSETLLIVGELLSAPDPSYDDLLISQNLSTVYAQLATTRPILERAIDRLDLDVTALDLISRVEAEAGPGSFVALAVEDDNAERAAATRQLDRAGVDRSIAGAHRAAGECRGPDRFGPADHRQPRLLSSRVKSMP